MALNVKNRRTNRATGAGEACQANAAGTCTPTQGEGRAKRAGRYQIAPEGRDAFTIEARGRVAWALDRLRLAGPKGCTPIEQPAPRWSAYIHTLRRSGVPIETVTEKHGGEFAGHHARYVLRSIVAPVAEGRGTE